MVPVVVIGAAISVVIGLSIGVLVARRRKTRWVRWHRAYEVADSPLRFRLAVVQGAVSDALAAAPAGGLRIASLCAGRGRDVIEVLTDHPRAADVDAHLVELDPTLAADANRAGAGLPRGRVTAVVADASTTDALAGIAPVQLLLLCGVFGNVSDTDVRRTVELLPTLLAPSALVIWTRHRRPPDLTPSICQWFGEAGFTEVTVRTPDPDRISSVHVHRLNIAPQPFRPGVRLFTFGGDETTTREPRSRFSVLPRLTKRLRAKGRGIGAPLSSTYSTES